MIKRINVTMDEKVDFLAGYLAKHSDDCRSKSALYQKAVREYIGNHFTGAQIDQAYDEWAMLRKPERA